MWHRRRVHGYGAAGCGRGDRGPDVGAPAPPRTGRYRPSPGRAVLVGPHAAGDRRRRRGCPTAARSHCAAMAGVQRRDIQPCRASPQARRAAGHPFRQRGGVAPDRRARPRGPVAAARHVCVVLRRHRGGVCCRSGPARHQAAVLGARRGAGGLRLRAGGVRPRAGAARSRRFPRGTTGHRRVGWSASPRCPHPPRSTSVAPVPAAPSGPRCSAPFAVG